MFKNSHSGSSFGGYRNFGNNNRGNHCGVNNYGNNNNYKNRGQGRKISTFNPARLIKEASFQNNQAQSITEKYQNENSFADFAINEKIKANLLYKGYREPTPIQDQIIPFILAGKDVVGIAATGTGKTAAFLIPLIDKVSKNPKSKVLIITPTRELALQIRDELEIFSHNLPISSVLCIGGAAISRQAEKLKRNPTFVIGTPGRLSDFKQKHKLHTNEFDTIVLDEVDRMLDMGFVHDVKALTSDLPESRQSLFFSATTNYKVEAVMQGFLRNPALVTIKSPETRANIKQEMIKVGEQGKLATLEELLKKKEFQKVLVFGRTKWGMEKLSKELDSHGFKVASIHGNKSQGQRQKALQQFREDRIQVLLATDVVSRGLDIKNVSHVINYDLPECYEDYIHRIGRTGRADKTGVALTFMD